jgi:hypothetical protein
VIAIEPNPDNLQLLIVSTATPRGGMPLASNREPCSLAGGVSNTHCRPAGGRRRILRPVDRSR